MKSNAIIALAAMLNNANKNLRNAASNGERFSPALGLDAIRKETAAQALRTIGVPVLDPYAGQAVVRKDGTQFRVIHVSLEGDVVAESVRTTEMFSGDIVSFSTQFTEAPLPEGCEH
jgi:hypothetical protein